MSTLSKQLPRKKLERRIAGVLRAIDECVEIADQEAQLRELGPEAREWEYLAGQFVRWQHTLEGLQDIFLDAAEARH